MRCRWVAPLLMVAATAAAAPRPSVSAAMPPTVVMVRVGAPADVERREKKFYEELTVALDGFMLMGVPAPRPDFTQLALSAQIAAVLPEATANEALAVVWMSFPVPKQVVVHLVALGSGRAFVRTIETDRSASSESHLALVARELLGTAYLFDAPTSMPVEMKQVVSTVRKQIPAQEPVAVVAPPPAPERSWEAWARGTMEYPLAGGVGAAPVVLGGVAIVRRLPFQLSAGLAVDAGGSRVMRGAVDGNAFFLQGSASLFRGFDFSKVSVGPMVSGGATWGRFSLPGQTVDVVLPSVQVGVQARTEMKGPAIAVSVLGGYQGGGAELRDDATVLFRTPSVKLTFALSVGWEGF